MRDCTASPTALWRAFGLTDDARFAARALDLAALELRMACRTLRDGREHGCNGRFIHGAGAGAVRTLCGAACANEVEYFAADGPRGLPAAMAALVCVDEAHPNARRVCLYNDGPNPQTIRIRPAKDQPPMRNAFAEDGQSLFKDGAAVVVAAARNVTVVVVRN